MLFLLSCPIILSLLVQGLYSLIDSLFLSRLGESVLSAVSLSFVVQNLSVSFFTGIATGMNAVISRAIGAGDFKESRNAVISGVAVQSVLVFCFVLFGVFGVPSYFSLSNKNAEVISNGIRYLRPLMLFSIFSCAQITSERLLQSTGQARYMLYSQVVGTVVNSVLDPIMIFGLLGCPALGIAGAAYATIIGQMSATVTALCFNFKKNHLLFDRNSERGSFSWKSAGVICKIGIPTSSTGIAACIGNYYINKILISFFDTANAAFGVYTKLQSVGLMPTQGFGAGLVTMIAFFLGRKDAVRIKKSLKACMLMIGVWNTLMTVVFVGFPLLLLKPFNPTQQMIVVGIPCFRIIGLTWFISGYMLAMNSFLQATGYSIFTLLISISRQVLVRTPVAIWLSRFRRPELIWWCWPISEITSDIVCIVFFIYTYRRIMRHLSKEGLGK